MMYLKLSAIFLSASAIKLRANDDKEVSATDATEGHAASPAPTTEENDAIEAMTKVVSDSVPQMVKAIQEIIKQSGHASEDPQPLFAKEMMENMFNGLGKDAKMTHVFEAAEKHLPGDDFHSMEYFTKLFKMAQHMILHPEMLGHHFPMLKEEMETAMKNKAGEAKIEEVKDNEANIEEIKEDEAQVSEDKSN